jgi:sodium pump decarboxylase gamma subunit
MDLISLQDSFAKSGFEDLAKDASFTDRLLYGLRVCAIGMLIVFAVLLILCGVLYLFKLYYMMTQKKKSPDPVARSAAAAEVAVADDEELTVAIATAAIAAARNDSDAAFRIVSIRKID